MICNPIAHENLSCHRSLKVLAEKLCQQGYTVLRFDYSGCGDSQGSFEKFSLSSGLKDIHSAVNHLKVACKLDKVCLLGVRLGASLALAYTKQFHALENLILWSPIQSGENYLKQLHEVHHRYNSTVSNIDHEYMGYQYNNKLIAEIASIRLQFRQIEQLPTLLLNDEPIATDGLDHIESFINADPSIWRFDPSKVVIPQDLIMRICSWLG